MTDPDDKPKEPEVLEAELVEPKTPRGNPNMVKGVTGNPGGLTTSQTTAAREAKRKWRELFHNKGIPFAEEYLDDPNIDKTEKMAVVLKMAEFCLVKPKAGEPDAEHDGVSPVRERTMVVTFVTPKKEGN
jgi:hypothetical protein